MSTIYKLSIYQTISVPVDVLGKLVVGFPGLASSIKHLVATELFDTNQKALDRQTYYTSTYPSAVFVFDVSQEGIS